MKRIIITNKQLNEVMDYQKTNVSFTGNTPTEMGANAKKEYDDALSSGLRSNAIAFTGKSPKNNETDATEATITIPSNTPDIAKAVQDGVTNYVNNGGDINKVNVVGNAEDITNGSTDESKRFSKRQIEEARLKKIRNEGFAITKKQLKEEWEEKPNDDANQWNDEFKMFMTGLRNREAIKFGDNSIAVQIFKGRTSENDPRYVTFTKGDNRLQDDHFYIQHSPCLKPSIIREIYSLVGWEPDENCEDYYPLNEDEVAWNQRKQMRMDNFWDTREVPGLNSISESYAYIDNTDDVTGGFDIDQFISDFREIEEKYYDLPEDYELQEFYNILLDDWTDLSDEERLTNKNFREYCNGIMADLLSEKYAEKGMNKIRENKIEINPKNKGKFNATKKKTGKSTEELTHSKNPLTRKRAMFAKMAKRNWEPLKS